MGKPSREYIYGINPAFEVIRAGRRTIYEAYVNEATRNSARLRKLTSFLSSKQIETQPVDKGRLYELAQSKEHQGIVLKCNPYPYVASDSLLESRRLVLVDNVEDPHNIGAILRCAEVFGFDGVLLPTKGSPEIYPSVVKVSAGASEHLKIARDSSANHYVNAAMAHDYTVIALDAKGTSDLRELAGLKPDRLLLVVGGEAAAVGQFILNSAHHVARIEQRGRVNSLNASVAAGIAMFMLAAR